jgi:hypothetical protein
MIGGAGIETVEGINTLTYKGASGETLTIRWDGPFAQDLILRGRVVGKEYHSSIAVKLRGWWDRLRRMLHW